MPYWLNDDFGLILLSKICREIYISYSKYERLQTQSWNFPNTFSPSTITAPGWIAKAWSLCMSFTGSHRPSASLCFPAAAAPKGCRFSGGWKRRTERVLLFKERLCQGLTFRSLGSSWATKPSPCLHLSFLFSREIMYKNFLANICKNIYIRSCSENYCNLTQFTTIWLRGIGCLPGSACIPVFAACIFHRWSAGCPNAKGGDHTVSRTECTEMDLVSCLCFRWILSRSLFLHNYAVICQYL